MDSDSDLYYEESSDNEEVAAPLHITLEVNLEESPAPPVSIPFGELSPVWKLPDDGTNFINFFTRSDVLELKHWAEITRQRRNKEGYMVEEPVLS